MEEHSISEELIVVKRSGQRTEFKGEKIAIAIKKAFDSVESIYTEDDVNKVYRKVLKEIEKKYYGRKTIKIEDIQDIIEEVLQKLNFKDVYESFSQYRERRAASRETFAQKQQHKFLKAVEALGLSEGGAIDESFLADNPLELMLRFGSVVSKEFAKAYLLDNKYVRSQDEGQIYIHNIEFLPIGTTNNLFIDLDKLFEKGFQAGYGFLRSPNDMHSYVTLATVAIKANQKDQHGEQAIPHFDHYMATGVLKTFKKQLKWILEDYLNLEGFDTFLNLVKLNDDIKSLGHIDFDIDYFSPYFQSNEKLKQIFVRAKNVALQKTEKQVYQAMEAFVHNLNTTYTNAAERSGNVSINLGTDVSVEGRMILENYLKALKAGLGKGEMPIYIRTIFKVKKGINLYPKDKNYDMLILACELARKDYPIHFIFLDASYNKNLLDENQFRGEVSYMGSTYRILENVADKTLQISAGRGNLSQTTINLPRLGIKYGLKYDSKPNMQMFYSELDNIMNLVKNQLLQRLEIQCSKGKENFKFLLGSALWLGSENLKEGDRLKKVLKHGTLGIGFVGLAECLKALIGHHHGESEKALQLGKEIVSFMRQKCDEYTKETKLNFVLIGINELSILEDFIGYDRSIYGKIKGVTDKKSYTASFHLPSDTKYHLSDKIKKESIFHPYTNGGHVLQLSISNGTKLEDLILEASKHNIGHVTFEINAQEKQKIGI